MSWPRIAMVAVSVLAGSLELSAMEAIQCGEKMYSLDYALTKTQPPFGEIWDEANVSPGSFAQNLVYLTFFAKGAPDLQDELANFLENQNNETDFSKPILWQPDDLPFPPRMIPIAELPGLPAECLQEGQSEVQIRSVVKKTKQGDLIIYHYDQPLMALLSLSNVQRAFLIMGVFLNDFAKDPLSSAQLNSLVHSRGGIYFPHSNLQSIFSENTLPRKISAVCERSTHVVRELQRELGIPCEDIKNSDLLSAQSLSIEGEGSDSFPFLPADFLGLQNLQNLTITHMKAQVRTPLVDDLKDLLNLQSLTLTHHWIEETPKNFMEGPYRLRHLDLSWNNIFEFKRNAFRQIFPSQIQSGSVTLNLSHNTAEFLPRRRVYVHPGAFDNCLSVTDLFMKDMNLTELKASVFDPLVNLQILDLSQNRLRRIENILTSPALKALKKLDLSENPFEYINADEFSELSSLQSLRLEKNNLPEFPEFLLTLPQLKELIFCGRKFTLEKYQSILELAQRVNPSLSLQICD